MAESKMSGRALVAVFLVLLVFVAGLGAVAGRVVFAGKRPGHDTLQRLANQQADAKQRLIMDMHQKRLAAAGIDGGMPDAGRALPIRKAGKSGSID